MLHMHMLHMHMLHIHMLHIVPRNSYKLLGCGMVTRNGAQDD